MPSKNNKIICPREKNPQDEILKKWAEPRSLFVFISDFPSQEESIQIVWKFNLKTVKIVWNFNL
jgi:hypothetical protein